MMIWLNIFSNATMLMIAETLIIIIGSMLMGILLAYFYWSGFKKQVAEMQTGIADEKRQAEDLRDQLNELLHVREELKNEISVLQLKSEGQAKMIYDHNLHTTAKEAEYRNQKSTVDALNQTIDSYQRRLSVIEEELAQAKNSVLIPHKIPVAMTVRANYDHVSQLLGKPVTENDLTMIAGIGPKAAFLLQSQGIDTWQKLSLTSADQLRQILNDAGGVYKSLDPASWPKQALMAAQSEWRKLRVYQETLKKGEQS